MNDMTPEKMVATIDYYSRYIQELGIEADPYPHNRVVRNPRLALGHLLSMTPKMRQLVEGGRRDKFMRWLGFLQGALWMAGHETIDELKDIISRPDVPSE